MSDLRQFPRIHTQLKAILTNSSNTESTATINNISPGGVLLHGDLALKQHICELEERDPMYHSIEVFLKCRFPEEPQPFLSRCRLIYVRRLSQHEFDFGLRFVDLSEVHAGMLHRFIFQPKSKVVPLSTRKASGQG